MNGDLYEYSLQYYMVKYVAISFVIYLMSTC